MILSPQVIVITPHQKKSMLLFLPNSCHYFPPLKINVIIPHTKKKKIIVIILPTKNNCYYPQLSMLLSIHRIIIITSLRKSLLLPTQKFNVIIPSKKSFLSPTPNHCYYDRHHHHQKKKKIVNAVFRSKERIILVTQNMYQILKTLQRGGKP